MTSNNAFAVRTCIVGVVVTNESNMASFFPDAGNLNGSNADMCSDVTGPSSSSSSDLFELSDLVLIISPTTSTAGRHLVWTCLKLAFYLSGRIPSLCNLTQRRMTHWFPTAKAFISERWKKKSKEEKWLRETLSEIFFSTHTVFASLLTDQGTLRGLLVVCSYRKQLPVSYFIPVFLAWSDLDTRPHKHVMLILWSCFK